jgi:hypothetical protein
MARIYSKARGVFPGGSTTRWGKQEDLGILYYDWVKSILESSGELEIRDYWKFNLWERFLMAVFKVPKEKFMKEDDDE